ncbi:DUF2325 domain-containing protein [Paraburkholderia sp. J94]|uniref:DUF2325 domain-containing protein n=1 Tax=Paraburkholderia sp. J94 TaxID=2805441 RepID=UPI002AB1A78E|nr:DUF2325 domain-containing protein [Paraburkholderia sp. J94]
MDMVATDLNWVSLCDEHGRVVRELGRAQRRASAVIVEQAKRIAALEAQAMQLRAAVVIRETALAWTRDELQDVKAAVTGLPKRLALVQQVRVLEARVQALTRGASGAASATGSAGRRRVVVWISQDRQVAADTADTADLADTTDSASSTHTERALAQSGVRLFRTHAASAEQLKAGLADADLVICQAGCVSHGDWWRVQDYCARTGKQCVLVAQPDALDRVTMSRNPASADSAD